MAVTTLLGAHLTPHSGMCEHALPRVRPMREDLGRSRADVARDRTAPVPQGVGTDDLVQDTFERALKHLEAGRPAPTQMRPWLTSILRNAFIDRIRRKAVTLFESMEDAAQPETEAAPPWGECHDRRGSCGRWRNRACTLRLTSICTICKACATARSRSGWRSPTTRWRVGCSALARRCVKTLERGREVEGREAVAK